MRLGSTAVQALTSFLDIEQRKKKGKGGLTMDEERGETRQGKRERECTLDLFVGGGKKIIRARFNFNKCDFAFRLGHSL